MKKNTAVFLDRDGTLLKERGYLASIHHMRFYQNVWGPLRSLQRAGLKLIVVTNQSGVGRGYFTLAQMNRINRYFKRQLQKKGVRLTSLYACPHRPDAGCGCRKPALGLIHRAARRHGVAARHSYVVGDQARDVQMAANMKGKGVLVLTGAGRSMRKKALRFRPHVARNLKDAVRWILNDVQRQ